MLLVTAMLEIADRYRLADEKGCGQFLGGGSGVLLAVKKEQGFKYISLMILL